MSNQIIVITPTVYVLSYHPLVYSVIKKTMAEYSVALFSVLQVHRLKNNGSAEQAQRLKSNEWILIVDTCSVNNWLEIVIRHGFMNRQPVIILANEVGTQEEEFQMLHLGVRGIVTISRIESDLRAAVEAVMVGRLWIRRGTLDAYIMQKAVSASSSCGFTPREEQIIPCLVEGFTNKEISHMLGISTRTVKFHVSNILHKIKVKSRRGLKSIKSSRKSRSFQKSLDLSTGAEVA